MELGDVLIESGQIKQKSPWKSVAVSALVHGAGIALLIFLSMSTTESAEADEAIPVFVTMEAAPPPPPPPPPPASNTAPQQRKVEPKVEPVEVPQESFVQPQEIPDEIPVVDPAPVVTPVETAPSTGGVGGVAGGVEGGVVGGVVGGVLGGTLGGEVGGQIGGVVGGVQGGVVGGVPGGTRSGPLRVGGDVKAPKITTKVEPEYTEVARKARIQGIVILEAIIDKQGNVDQVKVLRGLPMGLTESAVAAVKRWKFRPGTMNGRPVDVIFNLTVNFRLGGDGASVSRGSSRPAPRPQRVETAPAPEPEPVAPAPEPALPTVAEPSEPETPAPTEPPPHSPS